MQECFSLYQPLMESPDSCAFGATLWPPQIHAGSLDGVRQRHLQAIEDLVGPEALEAGQGLVQPVEFFGRKPYDLFDRL